MLVGASVVEDERYGKAVAAAEGEEEEEEAEERL